MSEKIEVNTDQAEAMKKNLYGWGSLIKGHWNVLQSARSQFEPGIGQGPVSDSIRANYEPKVQDIDTATEASAVVPGNMAVTVDENIAGLVDTEAQATRASTPVRPEA
jgi:hypothetical protein